MNRYVPALALIFSGIFWVLINYQDIVMVLVGASCYMMGFSFILYEKILELKERVKKLEENA